MRFGAERWREAEMADIRLLARSSVRRRLRRGRFPRVIMLLSVKSIASCWSCVQCQWSCICEVKDADVLLLHRGSRLRVFCILFNN